ncbi:glycosyltransferase family 9 protein [Nocardioides sp. TF02-7]|nr:glycosyltransferase family 9 protein [Nocardioides sp. TF02-7]UMG93653.1 glycosyltransferase family 9 protein [Nocardioides sp. TF02-7]
MTHRLAVRLDNIGDLLVTGPALRALRATSDRLTLLCGPRGRAVAPLLPGIDDVVCWRAPWIDPEPDPVRPGALDDLVATVAALGIDEAVVFTSFHQSPLPTALALRLAGCRGSGPSARTTRDRCSTCDSHRRATSRSRRPRSAWRAPAGVSCRPATTAACGSTCPSRRAATTRCPVRRPAGRGWCSTPAPRCRPGRGRPTTSGQRPPSSPRRATTSWSPAPPDEAGLTAHVAGGTAAVRDLGGRTDLVGLAAVLRDADAVVVGNTGPAHLAAAVGTPVVSLFAPTVPAARWAPYGVPVELLGDAWAPCRATRATVCPVPGHPCLASVTPAEVVRAVGRIRRGAAAPVASGVLEGGAAAR